MDHHWYILWALVSTKSCRLSKPIRQFMSRHHLLIKIRECPGLWGRNWRYCHFLRAVVTNLPIYYRHTVLMNSLATLRWILSGWQLYLLRNSKWYSFAANKSITHEGRVEYSDRTLGHLSSWWSCNRIVQIIEDWAFPLTAYKISDDCWMIYSSSLVTGL